HAVIYGQRLPTRRRRVGRGLRLPRLPAGALLLAPCGLLLLLVREHLRRQGPLVPHRCRGVADRARPVAGIGNDGILIRAGVVSHPGVLRRVPASGAAGGRMHVPVCACDEEGTVPAATETERLPEPVDLPSGTLHLLLVQLGLAQRSTESPPCRLGCCSAVRQRHPFTGGSQHLLIALAPATSGRLPVTDRPMQFVEVYSLTREGRRQLRRRRLRVLIECDRICATHIESELLDQRRAGGVRLPGGNLHVSFTASDGSELAPVALLSGVSLSHDARHDRFPPVDDCSPWEVGGAPRRRDKADSGVSARAQR